MSFVAWQRFQRTTSGRSATAGARNHETPIETLILHWDGSRWSQVPSPNVSGGANQLFGITAISANDIWAVGTAGGAPLAMRWNGSDWSVVPLGVGTAA